MESYPFDGLGVSSQELLKLFFAEDGDAQFLGFGEFTSGIGTCEDVVGLGGNG
jgi:hypothetical protein